MSDGHAFYSFYFWKEVAKCFNWEPLTLALWYFNRKRAKEKQSIWKEFSENCLPEKGQTILFSRSKGMAIVCKWYNDIYLFTVSSNGQFYKNCKWASLEELEKL